VGTGKKSRDSQDMLLGKKRRKVLRRGRVGGKKGSKLLPVVGRPRDVKKFAQELCGRRVTNVKAEELETKERVLTSIERDVLGTDIRGRVEFG